jgi:hypothetical protein
MLITRFMNFINNEANLVVYLLSSKIDLTNALKFIILE